MLRAFLILFFSLLIFSPANSETVFKECNQGLRDLDIYALVVSPMNPSLAYAGSGRAIYRTDNAGKTWETSLTLKGPDKRVNFLSFNQKDANIIYAATQNGLLKIKSFNPSTWERLFSGFGELEKQCSCLFADGEIICLGTQGGLFISFDAGKNWQKAKGELGNSAITSIAACSRGVFVATADKLFISQDRAQNFSRIFTSGLRQGAAESEEEDSSSDSGQTAEDELGKEDSGISCVFIEENFPDKIYLASEAGISASSDNGASFSQVYSTGLGSARARNIVSNKDNLYVSTQKGVFFLAKDGQIWQNLYAGLLGSDVRFIALDSLDRLWVAADRGIFRSAEAYNGISSPKDKFSEWKLHVKDEPTIAEVQNAAIKYAEVIDPKRIENLRRGARLKALMPDVDLDYDKTITSYTNSSASSFYIGPQDWSLGLSWDLGDLVWSDQQRLIDSQVRLMVELRDDILTEVTRLYFERRRLQAELLTSPPQEPKAKLEKELRLEELTASIDALTGGYFSKELGMSKG